VVHQVGSKMGAFGARLIFFGMEGGIVGIESCLSGLLWREVFV